MLEKIELIFKWILRIPLIVMFIAIAPMFWLIAFAIDGFKQANETFVDALLFFFTGEMRL